MSHRHWHGGMLTFPDDTLFAGVDKNGWAAGWAPRELDAYPPSANHGNTMFAVHTSRTVIIWNQRRVKPADAPSEWSDLWDPKWKGKVAMDPPWRSIAVQGLARRLTEKGWQETKVSVASKLSRGAFFATFFLATLAALEMEGLRLEDL